MNDSVTYIYIASSGCISLAAPYELTTSYPSPVRGYNTVQYAAATAAHSSDSYATDQITAPNMNNMGKLTQPDPFGAHYPIPSPLKRPCKNTKNKE